MSKIEWTNLPGMAEGRTWNPINGCTVLSPGCKNCYAMKMAHRLGSNPKTPLYHGLTEVVNGKPGRPARPVWTGKMALNEKTLLAPLSWKAGRGIFPSMSDPFHEDVPDEWLDRMFAVMALCPQHIFIILTKRPARMREYLSDPVRARLIFGEVMWISDALARNAGSWKARLEMEHVNICFAGTGPLPNVWLGVSIEDQDRAGERVPFLLATPAAKRLVSVEPQLGRIILPPAWIRPQRGCAGRHRGIHHHDEFCGPRLDWVIAGGESGPGARPRHPDWPRSLRDQCAAAGVPFFDKQQGAWLPIIDRDNDDPDWRLDYKTPADQRMKERVVNLEGGHGFHGERVHIMHRTGGKNSNWPLDGVTHHEFPDFTPYRKAAA